MFCSCKLENCCNHSFEANMATNKAKIAKISFLHLAWQMHTCFCPLVVCTRSQYPQYPLDPEYSDFSSTRPNSTPLVPPLSLFGAIFCDTWLAICWCAAARENPISTQCEQRINMWEDKCLYYQVSHDPNGGNSAQIKLFWSVLLLCRKWSGISIGKR